MSEQRVIAYVYVVITVVVVVSTDQTCQHTIGETSPKQNKERWIKSERDGEGGRERGKDGGSEGVEE